MENDHTLITIRLGWFCMLVALAFTLIADTSVFPQGLPLTTIFGMCAWTLLSRRNRIDAPGRVSPFKDPWSVLILLVLFWGLLHLFPFPRSIMGHMGAAYADAHALAGDMVAKVSDLGLSSPPWPVVFLSRNLWGSLRFIMLAACAVAIFSMARNTLPHEHRRVMMVVFILGTCLAVTGIISQWYVPQEQTLWWVASIPDGIKPPMAGFASRNHFGALLTLIGIVASCYAVDPLPTIRERIASAVMAVIMAVGIIASHSRGAMLAGTTGLVILLITLVYRKQWWSAARMGLLGIILLGLILLNMPENTRGRLATFKHIHAVPSVQFRMAAWRDALLCMRQYPWIGTGPNAFRMVYPQYRQNRASAHMTHAENDWIEAFVEAGSFAFMGMMLLGVAVWHSVHHASTKPIMQRAIPALIATVVVNTTVDFPLKVPGYVLILVWLTGSCAPPSPLVSRSFTRIAQIAAGIMIVGSIGLACTKRIPWIRLDDPALVMQLDSQTLAIALQGAPTSWHAWYAMSRHAAAIPAPQGPVLAAQCLDQATRLDPRNHRLWMQVGFYRQAQGDSPGARFAFETARSIATWMNIPEPDLEPR
ncbi:MAG: hypothetical protein A2269_00945 [Lentisphaerae bacterium RIFOXYA12_FULL_60_10]|nr:MAG: hypothetical protein A2269_00945 [Lentisphaerae bacterium RIFOXYA12_FULL_60_10]